jgi:hypothetical protein
MVLIILSVPFISGGFFFVRYSPFCLHFWKNSALNAVDVIVYTIPHRFYIFRSSIAGQIRAKLGPHAGNMNLNTQKEECVG